MHCFICDLLVSVMYLVCIVTDTCKYIHIHTRYKDTYKKNVCIVCICMYHMAYLVHIVCISYVSACIFCRQNCQSRNTYRYIQIHTDMHKICTKCMQNACKIHANTCTKFKGPSSAYLYVLVCIGMYHVCIFGGVHILCTCIY